MIHVVQCIQVTIKLALLLGGWGLFLVLFLSMLIQLSISSTDGYVAFDFLQYSDSSPFFTAGSTLAVLNPVLHNLLSTT